MIEMLYEKKYIKVLIATETFAVGINMPTKTVCFTSLFKHDGVSKRKLYSHEFIQMAGRAGRRNIDKIGNVILLTNLYEKISENDYYNILNVDRNATDDEIKKSYRALSYKYHPDRNNNEDTGSKMKEINEAYETLKDPQKKKMYDLGPEIHLEEIIGNLFNGQKFKRASSNPIEELFNEHISFSTFMNHGEIQTNIEKKNRINI